MDKPLPHNAEMEMAVLGSMLVSLEAAKLALSRVDPVWFYVEKHQKIFQVLSVKIEDGLEPDIILASQWLTDAGILGAVGGQSYLSDCMEKVSTSAHIDAYMQVIRKLHLERNICRALATAHMEPSPEHIEALRQASQDRDCATVNGIISVKDCADAVGEMLKPRAKGIYDLFDMKTVDERHNGMEPGNILTIAARPGVGKTVMATHIASKFLRKYPGEPVLYFSTEMEHRETMMRILAPMSRVPGWKWRKRYFNDEDKQQVGLAYREFLQLPFFMMDKPSPTMADIRAGMVFTKCRLVIVDYLQRLNVEEGRDGLPAALGRAMKGIKNAARSLGAMAVVLSQMDRETDHLKGRGTPQLADLKGSGDIEQESDAVFLMWKHNKRIKGTKDCVVPVIENIRPIELIHAKDRHGISDVSTQLIFDEKFIEFREWDKAEEEKYKGTAAAVKGPPKEFENGTEQSTATDQHGWSYDKDGKPVKDEPEDDDESGM